MVKIISTYKGQKNCLSIHTPSGAKLVTDAPKDNQGLGQSFSPTDLMATALVSCILTTLAIKLESEGLDLSDAEISVDKIMSADGPRRIAVLPVHLKLAKNTPEGLKTKIEEISRSCPVKMSLHPDIKINIQIEYR